MELLYHKAPFGNFGDDLNEVMWRELLPADMFEEDDAVLMGIGSIFNEEQTPAAATRGKRMFVLGTGAGYGPLPHAWRNWSILAVRGPLTAKLIDRPDLAATDAAALLAVLPSIVTLAPERNLTLFIPHHHSMVHGKWESVARSAGLYFVDPRWELSRVMSCFSKARLVVTEAMHGAIIADTLRIPWIPVNTSPDVLPFKWRDWTLSLDVPYRPKTLSASSFWERHHHRWLTRQAKGQGLTAPGLLREVDSSDFLIEDFLRRYRHVDVTGPMLKVHAESKVPSKTLRKILTHAAFSGLDPVFVEIAARELKSVSQGTSYLSRDAVFAEKLERLQTATYQLVTAIRR